MVNNKKVGQLVLGKITELFSALTLVFYVLLTGLFLFYVFKGSTLTKVTPWLSEHIVSVLAVLFFSFAISASIYASLVFATFSKTPSLISQGVVMFLILRSIFGMQGHLLVQRVLIFDLIVVGVIYFWAHRKYWQN